MKTMISLLITGILTITTAAFAGNTTYSVSFADNSKYQNISLKNAQVHIHLYADGNPRGDIVKKTDANQSFTINNQYGDLLAMQVVLIAGDQQNIVCQGSVHGGATQIKLDCRSI